MELLFITIGLLGLAAYKDKLLEFTDIVLGAVWNSICYAWDKAEEAISTITK